MAVIDTIQLRRGTAAAWTSADPTLSEGEFGFETDTLRFKIGDGSTAWTSLAYITRAMVAKTANYTLVMADAGAICDASGGDFTITLPTAAAAKDQEFTVISKDTGTVTVDGDGSETINGSLTVVISVQWTSITVYSDGTEWFIK